MPVIRYAGVPFHRHAILGRPGDARDDRAGEFAAACLALSQFTDQRFEITAERDGAVGPQAG